MQPHRSAFRLEGTSAVLLNGLINLQHKPVPIGSTYTPTDGRQGVNAASHRGPLRFLLTGIVRMSEVRFSFSLPSCIFMANTDHTDPYHPPSEPSTNETSSGDDQSTPDAAPDGLDRRSFLRRTALSSAALGMGLWAGGDGAAHAEPVRPRADVEGEARNIIFLVSDGMSQGTLTMADHFLQRHHNRTSHWVDLYRDRADEITDAYMDVASLNSLVTGSASSASAWGCGHRINNNMVNMSPDEDPYRTICEIFRDAGKATGLVTTTRITHATPAGFGINMPHRSMEDAIAAQYLERGYDLLMGGGERHFHADHRDDGADLYGAFTDAGYRVIRERNNLDQALNAEKTLGIFFDNHLPYEVDRLHIDRLKRTVPSLAEMTDAALQRLAQHEEGFILQVEGGRVDHAAHSNDTAGLIHDQIAFDDAIGTVLDWVDGRDDTLVVITTDHGNANPGLNGIGDGYGLSNDMFDRIADFSRSNWWILNELDEDSPTDAIKERVEQATQIEMRTEEAEVLQQSLRGDFQAVYRARSRPSAVISAIQANYTAVNWIGSMHTSDYVPLVAMGPGSDTLGSFVRNTELFDLMVDTAGVREYAAA